jgi:hypothetical protein
MEIFSRWRTAIVQSPDLATIIAKANAGEKLEDDEQIKFSIFCDEIFFAVTVSYATSHQSGAVHDIDAEIDYVLSLFEIIPAGITQWNRIHAQLLLTAPELVTKVDERLGNNPKELANIQTGDA